MIFNETKIAGAYEVELNKIGDDRGYFARAWCQKEAEANGVTFDVAQANTSLSKIRGTLRGFHYQLGEFAEDKLIRVVAGRVFDVLIDLREDSPTFLQHITLEITEEKGNAILVPKGCANAILTLEQDVQLYYLVSNFYTPQAERGLRWNDPKLGIEWPIVPSLISDKDANHPDFDPEYHLRLG